MPGYDRRRLSLVGLLSLLFALAACAPADPQARVAESRAKYEVKLNGWLQRPVEEGQAAEAAAGASEQAASSADPGAASQEAALAKPDPRQIKVLMDLLVTFTGRKPLPGITVDISHADADGNEKAHRQHYVALAGMHRGAPQQVEVELDGWDLEDGDQFSVEVRQDIPEAERGAYREFQEAGS